MGRGDTRRVTSAFNQLEKSSKHNSLFLVTYVLQRRILNITLQIERSFQRIINNNPRAMVSIKADSQMHHLTTMGLMGNDVVVNSPASESLKAAAAGGGDSCAPTMDTTTLGWETSVSQRTFGGGGGGGLNRTKSHFSMASVVSSVSSSSGSITLEETNMNNSSINIFPVKEDISMDTFGMAIRHYLGYHEDDSDATPEFDKGMRKVMEPYLRKARLQREKKRNRLSLKVDASIASSVGVPYISLRQERPFLFDEYTFPLHTALAETLQVTDLTKIHEMDEREALAPLLDPERRVGFHRIYDNFVTTFCIPLLHSLAIAKNVLHDHSRSSHDCVTYRYQAFPSINIVRPGAAAKPPSCGVSDGHSLGCLFFHIPLTPSMGTSALYVESHPGREDWHPLQAKSVGLGFLYDGARCLQFGLEHTNRYTSRVSLDFCIMIYRENKFSSSSSSSPPSPYQYPLDPSATTNLCTPDLLEDSFSRKGPGYYEEACIDMNRTIALGTEAVLRKSRTLQEPDYRVGPPFDSTAFRQF